jgi:hypothetical protein
VNTQPDLFKVAAELLVLPIQMDLCETRSRQVAESAAKAREIRDRANALIAQIDAEFPRKFVGAFRVKGSGYVALLVAVRDCDGMSKGDEVLGATVYATAELAHAAARRWAMAANRGEGEAA